MEEYLKPLLTNAGFAGALLVWHIYIVGKKLNALEEAMNRLTQAILIRFATNPQISAEIKEKVTEILSANTKALKDHIE